MMKEPLYETASCVVIDKPSKMGVMRGARRSVEAAYPHWPPVHRIDNETSGCLLLAKTNAAFANLRAQFEARTVIKVYLALVDGLTPKTCTYTTPIAHHITKDDRMVLVQDNVDHRSQPQEACTQMETLEHFLPTYDRPAPYSLIKITIPTGVRHQIRVHLAGAGAPIVGEAIYGKRTTACTRHLLHAYRLSFHAPDTDELVTVVAPLGDDFCHLATQCGIDLLGRREP
jgi:23S rRNA pseudouridine1911/1915/1917 synthase